MDDVVSDDIVSAEIVSDDIVSAEIISYGVIKARSISGGIGIRHIVAGGVLGGRMALYCIAALLHCCIDVPTSFGPRGCVGSSAA